MIFSKHINNFPLYFIPLKTILKTTIWINSSLYIQHIYYTTRNLNRYNDNHLRIVTYRTCVVIDSTQQTPCALAVKDVDFMFTWQRAKQLCARCQGRWFDVYLTTSEATVCSLSRTFIWCLLDNERSDCALVVKDVELMFTWQRAKRLRARCQRMWCSLHGVYDWKMFNWTKNKCIIETRNFWYMPPNICLQ